MREKSSTTKSKTCLEKHGDPHLSGAYIRSLVKQLTSARTKDSSSSSSKDGDSFDGDGGGLSKQRLSGYGPEDKMEKSNEAPPQHKKQVRRRLHTTRPYQERLLNMAEARREIVTALKFHRAAMKKASEKQRLLGGGELRPEGQTVGPFSHQLFSNQEIMLKSRRIPRFCDENYSNHITLTDNHLPGYCSPYYWPVSPVPPPPPPPPPQFVHENLNFFLPSQTLGLNLNLEDFNCLDTDTFHCGKKPCSIFSSSSSSSPLSATVDEIPCMAVPASAAVEVNQSSDWRSHHAMDDKELADIKSIGEQHQMEWNDTLNLVTSAWWFKFSNTLEIERSDDVKCEDLVESPFDGVMEFPAWLNAKEENCLEHVNEDYSPALPCMEIEEIEGMDGDWLA